jgi:hypothetical protein
MKIKNTKNLNRKIWHGLRGPLIGRATAVIWLILTASAGLLIAVKRDVERRILLPASKLLTLPAPGRIGSVNGLPATVVLSPDERYAALLNDGYGTDESGAYQSITVL